MKFNKAKVLAIGAAAMMAVMSTPCIPTFADTTYGTGNVTINAGSANVDSKTNEGVTYKGYQIFKANVSDDAAEPNNTDQYKSGKTETNIAWVSDDVKNAVEKAIKDADSAYAGTTAQDAAEYLIEHLGAHDSASDVSGGKGTRVDSTTLAHSISKALDASGVPTEELTAGTKKEGLAEGYWLFVTKEDSTNSKTDKTGTAPIFAVVGGSDVTITEKTSIPTVDKKVTNDVTGSEKGVVADSQIGQDIAYELTGTVADNIGTFDTYKYKFTDTLPEGMTADADSVKVYAQTGDDESTKVELKKTTDASDKTGYTLAYDTTGQDLVVDFLDLKSVDQKEGQTKPSITKDTKIIVDYNAKLDASKADKINYGSKNQNTVKLTYSNNPYSEGTGDSTPKTTSDYVYKLKLHKIDRTTEVNLSGAKFTVQVKSGDESSKDGQYVQADGSLAKDAYEFTTDENGELTVPGLDVGTYTVTETTAPSGYDKTDAFDFTIGAEYKGEELTTLTNTLAATDSVIAGSTDGVTTDNVMKAGDKNDAADASTGTVLITVGDVKRISLPLTGQAGIAAGIAAGGSLILVSFAAIAKNKKKKEEEA